MIIKRIFSGMLAFLSAFVFYSKDIVLVADRISSGTVYDTEHTASNSDFSGKSSKHSVSIDEKHFPDANFRKYISKFDLNSDNSLDSSEISNVTEINISDREIKDLKGIRYFKELKVLDCALNYLTEIDISENVLLEKLNVNDNMLSFLDLSENKMLVSVSCKKNYLTNLDVSNNTELISLCCDNNKLTHIDLSSNEKLTVFECKDNTFNADDFDEKSDGSIEYDLSMLAENGFEPSKISDLKNALYNENTNKFPEFESNTITYTYDCGNDFKADFSLRIMKGFAKIPFTSQYESLLKPLKTRTVYVKWSDDQFEQSSYIYNNDLAIVGLALCDGTSEGHIEYTLSALGFDKESIRSEFYGMQFNSYEPARTFAKKEININGKTKTLVSVTIRGSATLSDWIVSDLIDGGMSGFGRSINNIINSLSDYMEENCGSVSSEDTIFFISGHSLGGAIASCLTIALSQNYPQENIYGYSFATPLYTKKYNTSSQPYENLYEIINIFDIIPKTGSAFNAKHSGTVQKFFGMNIEYVKYFMLTAEEITDFPVSVVADKKDAVSSITKNHDKRLYMAYLLSCSDSAEIDCNDSEYQKECYLQ